jgi:hypothetical protein
MAPKYWSYGGNYALSMGKSQLASYKKSSENPNQNRYHHSERAFNTAALPSPF